MEISWTRNAKAALLQDNKFEQFTKVEGSDDFLYRRVEING